MNAAVFFEPPLNVTDGFGFSARCDRCSGVVSTLLRVEIRAISPNLRPVRGSICVYTRLARSSSPIAGSVMSRADRTFCGAATITSTVAWFDGAQRLPASSRWFAFVFASTSINRTKRPLGSVAPVLTSVAR